MWLLLWKFLRILLLFLFDLERAGSRLWCLGGPSVSDWSLSVLWLSDISIRVFIMTLLFDVMWLRDNNAVLKKRKRSNKPGVTPAPPLSPKTIAPSWVRMRGPTWRSAEDVWKLSLMLLCITCFAEGCVLPGWGSPSLDSTSLRSATLPSRTWWLTCHQMFQQIL